MDIWNTNFCPLCSVFIFRPYQTPKNQDNYPQSGERWGGLIPSSGTRTTHVKFHKICPMIGSLGIRNLQVEIIPFRIRWFLSSISIFVCFIFFAFLLTLGPFCPSEIIFTVPVMSLYLLVSITNQNCLISFWTWSNLLINFLLVTWNMFLMTGLWSSSIVLIKLFLKDERKSIPFLFQQYCQGQRERFVKY